MEYTPQESHHFTCCRSLIILIHLSIHIWSCHQNQKLSRIAMPLRVRNDLTNNWYQESIVWLPSASHALSVWEGCLLLSWRRSKRNVCPIFASLPISRLVDSRRHLTDLSSLVHIRRQISDNTRFERHFLHYRYKVQNSVNRIKHSFYMQFIGKANTL